MNIRKAKVEDLNELTEIELLCFPVEEAASRESIKNRLIVYPDHFWVMEDEGKIIAYVNGMSTNEPILRDEMFEDASLHQKDGKWQMIFSVSTRPEYRNRGVAQAILNQVIVEAKENNRKGLVLTCKDRLVHYYEKFGFVNEGISSSTHGGVIWYDMRLELSGE